MFSFCRLTIHEFVLRSVKALFQSEFATVEFAGRLKKTAVVRNRADIGTWSHCGVSLDTCAVSCREACSFSRVVCASILPCNIDLRPE
jgi:hypothetical protein